MLEGVTKMSAALGMGEKKGSFQVLSSVNLILDLSL